MGKDRVRQSEQLRYMEDKFRGVFNAVNDAVFITDPEQEIILEANQKAEELMGIPVEELIGRHVSEFYPKDKSRKYYQNFKRSMVTENPRLLKNIEIWKKRPDGVEVPVELNVTIIETMGKKLLVAVFRDLTEKKRLERELAGLKTAAVPIAPQTRTDSLKKLAVETIGLGKMELLAGTMKELITKARGYHLDRSVPVLIRGEDGTGKGAIGKVIHYGDQEDTELPLIAIDCSGISPAYIECELFGCEPGICKGLEGKPHQGKLDQAQGGSLLLEGITDIPPTIQERMLQLIKEREYFRFGGFEKVKADVRLIFVSSADLEQAVEQGRFNRELYDRLKISCLETVPLRRRGEDILQLAEGFLREFSGQRGRGFSQVGREAAQVLMDYEWPGNVRELRNVIEWAVMTYDDSELKPIHLESLRRPPGGERLPGGFAGAAEGVPLEIYISRYVQQALEKNNGNKAKTARYLGISRPSLYKYLQNLDD